MIEPEFSNWIAALAGIGAFAMAGWLVSLMRNDVSIVDSMWSIMFLIAAVIYASQADSLGVRGYLVVILVTIWALRLALHITIRNWGEEEDHRYQKIREKNAPNFELKSIYIVFGLQAVLAWFISLPLLAGIGSDTPLGILDYAGMALWLTGFVFESVADYQLLVFKKDPANQGAVMDRGLWKYSRHPNYFGESCIWWGYFILALSAGGWWSILSPMLMTFLLLRVSGVAMLEKDIGNRRPAYAEYVDRTNAFFPGPARSNAS